MKFILMTLVILTFLVLITSCGNNTVSTSENETKTKGNTYNISETEEITLLIPDLPNVKYDGKDFIFLISGNIENGRQKNDFLADEMNGETFNDARYERNLKVQEKYDIKIKTIEEYGSVEGGKKLKSSIQSGDGAYDSSMLAGYACCELAYNNFLYNLNDLQYINLLNPWWDQKANSDLAINNRMYYTTGDISTADNDCTYSILFNKELVDSFSLENPYDLVKKGTWTIDEFTAMARAVSNDINGDGKYDKNDRFGAIVWDDTMMGIVNASGDKCCTVMPDGNIQLTLFNERILTMFEKFTSLVYQPQYAYIYQRVSYDIADPINMFSNNQALFYLQLMDLVTYFRNMKTDFGILPYPKYDESQDSYYHTIGSWHSVFLCVPADTDDAERTGIILESLAAESYYTVTPAYYEKTLVGKYTRDEESGEMLDIILSTRVYDLGWYYQIGGYNEEIMNLLRKYNTDFVSMYQTNESKATSLVGKINKAFAEITK